MQHSAPRSPRRNAVIGAMVLMLVLAQFLGCLHLVLHAPGLAHPHSLAADGGRTLESLFAGDKHGDSCVLYDQLAHGDAAVSVPLLVVPCGVAVLKEPAHPAWHLAAQAAGFLARGPPASV